MLCILCAQVTGHLMLISNFVLVRNVFYEICCCFRIGPLIFIHPYFLSAFNSPPHRVFLVSLTFPMGVFESVTIPKYHPLCMKYSVSFRVATGVSYFWRCSLSYLRVKIM
jgi:hypothetical protein